jgi:hypothetical protein
MTREALRILTNRLDIAAYFNREYDVRFTATRIRTRTRWFDA